MQQIENILGGKGGQLALAVIAFLVAAVLVLVIVRMLFGGKLRAPGGRARQARLGIVDAFDLDRQRQLIIIRRDNTEHLILIGGPNDLLIEPEIVRVEAREFRNRDKEPGDARIPAAFAPSDRPELKSPADAPAAIPPAPSPDEPPLPLPLPEVAAAPPQEPVAPPPTAPRGPTFPLPPRRPAPPPAGERRPPVPPRLPDSVSRTPEPIPNGSAPELGAPSAPLQAQPPSVPQPATLDVSPAGPVVPPTRPVPSFRPLPPRPPLRPLQRVTPKPAAPSGEAPAVPDSALPSAPAQAPAASAPALPTIPGIVSAVPPAPSPVATAPEPPPAAPAHPSPPPPSASTDDDLSLEEEMAKLLGRG